MSAITYHLSTIFFKLQEIYFFFNNIFYEIFFNGRNLAIVKDYNLQNMPELQEFFPEKYQKV